MSNIDQSRSASLLLDAVEKGAFLLANNLYEGRFSDRAPNVGRLTSFPAFFSFLASLYKSWTHLKTCVLLFFANSKIWKCMFWTQRLTYRTWHFLTHMTATAFCRYQHRPCSSTATMVSGTFKNWWWLVGIVLVSVLAKNVWTHSFKLFKVLFHPGFAFAGQVKLVLSLFKNLGPFLSTQNSTLRLGPGPTQGQEPRRRSFVVNSHVISASVHRGTNRVYLTEPVIFTLRHLQVCSFEFNYVEINI